MALRWDEFVTNFERYKRILPDDEPIVFPRREAKRRAANKEKRHRIMFDCDEVTYAAFHLQRERMLHALEENPTLFGVWLTEVMESWSDAMLQRWKENHESSLQ